MNKILARSHAAPLGEREPVRSISHADLCAVEGPLLEALGASLATVISGTVRIEHDRITFLTIEPMAGVEPIAYRPNRPSGYDVEWAAIWAWPVTVRIELS